MAAGFDYLENALVSVMLRAGPEGLDAALVEQAALWTQAKFAAYAAAVIVLGLSYRRKAPEGRV